MFQKHIVGASRKGPGDALGEAISCGLKECEDASHLHFIVTRILQSDHHWKAEIEVLGEPKLGWPMAYQKVQGANSANEDKQELSEERRQALKVKEEEEEQNIKTREKYRKVKEQQDGHEAELIQKMKEEDDKSLVPHATLEDVLGVEKMITHLYIEAKNESAYRAVQKQYPIDYIHVMPSGALWAASKRLQPELDMYEASHPEEDKTPPHLAPSLAPVIAIAPLLEQQKLQSANIPLPVEFPSNIENDIIDIAGTVAKRVVGEILKTGSDAWVLVDEISEFLSAQEKTSQSLSTSIREIAKYHAANTIAGLVLDQIIPEPKSKEPQIDDSLSLKRPEPAHESL